MKFEVKKINREYTEEDLLDDIKRIVDDFDLKSLSMAEYDKFGRFSSSTITKRFGTWNEALSMLGIVPKNTFYSDKDLFDNIEKCWLYHGKQPVRRDMDNMSISDISSHPYLRRFGNWYKALDAFVEYINSNESKQENSDSMKEENITLIESVKITHKTNRTPSNRLKVMVLMRDGNLCKLCGERCNDGLNNIHFDHIFPWSKGGETMLENLQVLCSRCNEAKGNYYPEEY